jgi:Asp-tRNAAsn/Glu-tRNAGln amidotransferase A subunit and related amidases
VNAFVATDIDRAIADARDIDRRVATGEQVGALAGIPLGVKDSQDAAGFVTTHGSLLFADRPPAAEDCLIVARLRAADAVVIGKTNTAEFELGAETDNRVFGPTDNPLVSGLSAGGSSGGSAAAIAADMIPLATASDGGGSIRGPAAACDLPGFKPSLGVVPHADTGPTDWPTLSTRGVIARDVLSTAYAYDIVSGPHLRDTRSIPKLPMTDDLTRLGPYIPGVLAWSADLGWADTSSEVRQTIEAALATLSHTCGSRVVEAAPLLNRDPGREWTLLAATGTLRNLDVLRSDESSWELLTPGVRHILSYFSKATAAELWQAYDAGHEISTALANIFGQAEILLCPTSAQPPPVHAEARNPKWVGCTYAFNMANVPAGSIPIGRSSDGAPIALQIVGPRNSDVLVLRVMRGLLEFFQRDTGS